MNETPPQTPLISLVVPMYGVERYLSDFLDSLSQQQTDSLEVIFVDDGSPDASGSLVSNWLEAGGRVYARLIRQENAGLSGARNAGLAAASGVWISFPDPDDILGPDYLTLVAATLARVSGDVDIVATPLITFVEQTGEQKDSHPLRGLFKGGPRVIRLSESPNTLKIHANSSFLRRAVLERHGLQFDEQIRPNFEDTALIMRYLALASDPTLATVPSAKYLYRTRADASSLVASSWTNPAKYTVVPERGWLDTLAFIEDQLGYVPRWAQNIVLYDASWYFKNDAKIHSPSKSLDAQTKTEFLSIFERVLAYVDTISIYAYRVSPLSYEIRNVMAALKGELPDLRQVFVQRIDDALGLVQLRYDYFGQRPEEVIRVADRTIASQWSKDRAVTYYDRTAYHERLVWVEYGESLTIALNGHPQVIHPGPGHTPNWTLPLNDAAQFGIRRPLNSTLQLPSAVGTGRIERVIRRARSEYERRRAQIRRILQGRSPRFLRPLDRLTAERARKNPRYQNAWVFMDRDTQAQDNAEHLYRWVMTHHPEVNAWFALSTSSPDWKRLREEGFRLVAHGSSEHTRLLLAADHLLSSHVDHYVVAPLNTKRFGVPRWSYTFLQHGVTVGDISRWLNGKPIRRIISASRSEHDAFIADGTPYVFTEHEAALTGFPRHDALLHIAQSTDSGSDSILIVPTWREHLLGPQSGKGNFRALADSFLDSAYFNSWHEFLRSDDLAGLAKRTGKRIVFLPHPNLEPHLDAWSLPPHVQKQTYAGSNIQEVIASASVLITDYSSIAFDAAYLGTPIVYFQFDRSDFYASHPHRPGYFSADRDGFGPVVENVQGALTATTAALEAPHEWIEYRDRAEAFFAYRDGGACERVFKSVLTTRQAGAVPS